MAVAARRLSVILADTSILIDVLKPDSVWSGWSSNALAVAAATDKVCINEIVFAELATGYQNAAEVASVLGALDVSLQRMPIDALFLAGKAFQRYRTRGGTKTGVLPDFFIGAHAAIEGAQLLTRDPDRVRSYFPSVEVIAPA